MKQKKLMKYPLKSEVIRFISLGFMFIPLFLISSCGNKNTLSNKKHSEWVNKPAPQFNIEMINNQTFRLSDHVGNRVIVLNFFGTWCPPCRAEIPALHKFYEKNSDSILLLGLALNVEKANVKRFYRKLNVNFPTALIGDESTDKGIPDQYGVPTVPTTVVIGLDGQVKYYKPGMLQEHHFDQLKQFTS